MITLLIALIKSFAKWWCFISGGIMFIFLMRALHYDVITKIKGWRTTANPKKENKNKNNVKYN